MERAAATTPITVARSRGATRGARGVTRCTGTGTGTATSRHVAAGDCECIRAGWVAQPANALTSLSYLALGAVLLGPPARAGRDLGGARRDLALVAAVAGIGSAAYHGPGGRVGKALHDAGVAMLACAAPGAPVSLRLRRAIVGIAGAAAVVRPAATSAIAATGFAANLVGGVARTRRATPASTLLGVGAVLATGAALHATSRTGGPLCRPESFVQGHGAWHVLSAVGVGWWAQTVWAAAPDPGGLPR